MMENYEQRFENCKEYERGNLEVQVEVATDFIGEMQERLDEKQEYIDWLEKKMRKKTGSWDFQDKYYDKKSKK